MLDTFEILTTSGVVLWSRTYVPVGANIINSLIRDVFIEERTLPAPDDVGAKPIYRKESYTLKWTSEKDLGLIFVAVYQSLVHLTWIDKLLDNVRALFTGLYGEQLKKEHSSVVNCEKFSPYFERQMQELEGQSDTSSTAPGVKLTPPSSIDNDSGEETTTRPAALLKAQQPLYDTSADSTPVPTPDTSRPNTPGQSHLLTGKAGPGAKLSRRGRKKAAGLNSGPASSGDEASVKRKGKGAAKKNRVWGEFGAEEEDDSILDYSQSDIRGETSTEALEEIKPETWGRKTGKGQFVLKDLDEEMDQIIAEQNAKKQSSTAPAAGGIVGSSIGAIGGLFRNVVGGKTLTKEDLVNPLKGMEEHLLKKNVAREAAVRLCESVERDLVGLKTNSFTTIESTLRTSMEKALTKILTPTSSLDLLREIQTVNASGRPYVLSIVGVNGVGKSTNLSKIAFFLLQNHHRVLIAAADTFRSGAVEQLGVHVKNLKELSKREGGEVDIFQKGYGKDAANIAADAVVHAAKNDFNVVLIDTAGRRHNDQRLMSSLEKFGKLAKPDKILMVGEALVGSDSVAQARNFNASFGPGRGLDGFVISKCDTVGDMVGTLVSMVHATGIPVVFLGVGQHYADLRGLNVGSVCRLLMS
ncbi:P-loop containing nucleoside triphosphate hydrolase protein [Massarina eburnea CBS 473.64]|uniref:Signal recognition particle receptor subunit alpha homolog n=1 Tax=Massarina eburnea CBS 473.64 TaxID=1395130 RepID=A0A6A6RIK3_9PLEO|nr:P-loop containing nucleoside triphosphate hydrolase protein [Massarina eburnea CBS 473.64]